MRPRCVPIRATLDARGEAGLTESMLTHIAGCAACDRDLADRRAVTTALASLSTTQYPAPAEILPRVLDGIGPWAVPEPESRRHLVAVAAAAAVATAATAAAAGTAVLVRMHRSRAA